ncbi:MAG: glucose 1-dehydrogenase [Acidimicrobiia bacterium]|nr:glucose 1-dehydrogenase [Acidimicrobiia bacterium]
MTGRLAGKVAVVTGGASGIGAGTIRRFVAEGARCVVADFQADVGQALADEIGDDALFVEVDVTVEDQVAAVVDAAVERFGRLDCVFNNAGVVGAVGPIADTPVEAWDQTMAVLLRGVFLGMKHAARVMVPRGSGTIISTSSTAGITGGLGPHAYTAAKHAIVGLTKSVASELAGHGIRVNAIAPGNIVTAMTADVASGDPDDLETVRGHIERSSPVGRAGVPDDIAYAAVYLASDESGYLNGHTLVVDAGQTTGGRPSNFVASTERMIGAAGRRGV